MKDFPDPEICSDTAAKKKTSLIRSTKPSQTTIVYNTLDKFVLLPLLHTSQTKMQLRIHFDNVSPHSRSNVENYGACRFS